MKKKKKAKHVPVHLAEPGRKALRLHGSIARDIGVLIVSGRYRPGHVLDGEVAASSQRRSVSRTAYREAMRILSAKGLVNSRPRVGTRVSPLEEWHLLDPDVLAWAFSGEPEPEVLHGLFELRTIVEPAAAALAAARRQSGTSRQHASRARCDVDAHAECRGGTHRGQGVSRGVADGHRESVHRVADQRRHGGGECAHRVQTTHRAAQARPDSRITGASTMRSRRRTAKPRARRWPSSSVSRSWTRRSSSGRSPRRRRAAPRAASV